MAGRQSETDYGLLPSKKLTNVRSPVDLFLYLKANPKMIGVMATLFFSVVFVVGCGVLFYLDIHPNTCYFSAGVAGIAFNVYQCNHFRTLMALKKEINKYSKANMNFKAENGKLMVEIERFGHAKGRMICTYTRCVAPFVSVHIQTEKHSEVLN